jgi:hypothetical protein
VTPLGARHSSSARQRNQRNDFALVSPVNAKVLGIRSDDTVFWIYFAHSDKTEINQIRCAIFVSCCQGGQLWKMIVTVKGQSYQACICDASHFLENPLRVEGSRGPVRILPARRKNFFEPVSCDRARSKCCRTSSPCEIPVRAEVFSIHAARLFGSRIAFSAKKIFFLRPRYFHDPILFQALFLEFCLRRIELIICTPAPLT